MPTTLIYNGTTYVPLRFFSDIMGVPAKYEGASKTIFLGEAPASGIQTGYLSDVLKPFYIEKNYRKFETNKSMTMAGKTYTKGYQLKNLSLFDTDDKTTFSFNLEGNYKSLKGMIGLDDSLNTSILRPTNSIHPRQEAVFFSCC